MFTALIVLPAATGGAHLLLKVISAATSATLQAQKGTEEWRMNLEAEDSEDLEQKIKFAYEHRDEGVALEAVELLVKGLQRQQQRGDGP